MMRCIMCKLIDLDMEGYVPCRDVMMISRIAIKCAASLSSFVNKSARLIFPAMWRTSMRSDWIDSRTAFSRIWMWRRPLVVMLCDQHTHASLSLYTFVFEGICLLAKPRSSKMWCRYRRNLVHSSVA